MPSLKQIEAALEEIAPAGLAEEWDNSGTLVDCGGEVTAVLVALDITDEVVAEAEALGCQLIIAHHPVIFHPLKQVARGGIVYKLVRKGISAICAHTNLDAAPGGVNDILAAIFKISDPAPFAGCGRVGALDTPTTVTELCAFCAKRFGAHVRYTDTGHPVKTLAVLGGSGGGLIGEAKSAGADCLLTGEADHHDALDAKEAGLSLVAAGHFSTEFPVVPVLADWLAGRFPDIKATASRRNKDAFLYVDP